MMGVITANKKLLLPLALVAALTTAAYANSFSASFHLDDYHQIASNTNMYSLSNIPRFFVDATSGTNIAGLRGYRPVTTVSFALSYALSGQEVFGYHVVNFLLHLINSLLMFIVVRRVMEEANSEGAATIAVFASALFCLHPIQTGAVTYISGRAVLLATFFVLLSFYCFMAARAGGPRRTPLYAMSAVLFLLGLLSKEMAISLVFIVAAYGVFFPHADRGPGRARRLIPYLLLLAVVVVFLIIKRIVQGYTVLPGVDYDVSRYLMTEARVLLVYLRLLLFPFNQNADYAMATESYFSAFTAVGLAVAAGIAALAILFRKRKKAAAFFMAWFLLTLAPESTLVPILDAAVEYRLYLPSVGFFAVLATIIYRMVNGAARAPQRAIVVASLMLLAVLTFNRNMVWRNELSLWSDVSAKSPRSCRAQMNLGRALVVGGRYSDAVPHLLKAVEMDPEFYSRVRIHSNLGICYMNLGRKDDAEREMTTAKELFEQQKGRNVEQTP